MKAAIVLLTDYKTQNFVRRIVFALEREYQIDFFGSLLPAHVSLKQPFAFENMEVLEGYFDDLAASISPFRIELDHIYCSGWTGYGILGVNVIETPALRALHNRLNRELPELVADASALFDGDAYQFHLTIELGKTSNVDPYRAYYDRLTETHVNLAFLAREIALFYYTGEDHLSFINYKVLPLTGKG